MLLPVGFCLLFAHKRSFLSLSLPLFFILSLPETVSLSLPHLSFRMFYLAWLPRDPTFVAHFNEAAWRVINGHNDGDTSDSSSKVEFMDAYWLTLARPDHREVDINNVIGKHLVYTGRLQDDDSGKLVWQVLQELCFCKPSL
jgi:hypothetical protein